MNTLSRCHGGWNAPYVEFDQGQNTFCIMTNIVINVKYTSARVWDDGEGGREDSADVLGEWLLGVGQ
eukprot:6989693-Karenia_brevis.AAC.1